MAVGWAPDRRGRCKHSWSRCAGLTALHLLGSNISERARRSSSCQQLHLCLRTFFEAANVGSTHAWLGRNTGGFTSSRAAQELMCKSASSLPPRALHWLTETPGGLRPNYPMGNLLGNAACTLSSCFKDHLPNKPMALAPCPEPASEEPKLRQ